MSSGQPTTIGDAAARLRTAEELGQPCPPVRNLLGSADIDLAYAVQQLNVERRVQQGRSVVGRKIGLTSPAVQKQLGVDQPDFGILLDDMVVRSGGVVETHRLLQPKIEAEIAFWLSDDLSGPLESVADLRSSVRGACAALEIVDSRIENWDITITDTIADNASSGLVVLAENVVALSDFEPARAGMTLHRNGDLASSGSGSACLGDPLLALLWAAQTAQRFGSPLRAGDVVLSGALGPMVPVTPGDEVSGEITGLGTVTVSFKG